MPLSKPPRHPKKPARGDGDARRAMPAHAHLLDTDDRVMGGVALRDEDWVVVLQGRPVASTKSAGMAIAMLRHTASLLLRAGHAIRIDVSDTLSAKASDEGATAGKTLDEYLAFLEAERAERDAERGARS